MLALHTLFPVHRATIEKFGEIGTRGSGWTRPGNLVGNGPFVLESGYHASGSWRGAIRTMGRRTKCD
ncbi:MAG: hypothetical protein ACREIA_24850 [Opitutaceae bacterium]